MTIAVFTLATIVAAQLSGTETTAGLPSSTQTFSQALAALPIAVFMSRYGRRLGLTLSYLVGAVGCVLGVAAIFTGFFPLLLVSASLIGMGRAGSDQSRFAAGEMYPEARRAQMIGRLVFAGTIGAILGPALVSPSANVMAQFDLDSNMGPWAVGALISVLAALLSFFLLHPDPRDVAAAVSAEAHPLQPTEAAAPSRSLRELLALPRVQLALAAAAICQCVMVFLMSMTPLHMHHLHHDRDSISLVISMHTLGMYAFAPLTGYLIDRLGRIPMLLAAVGVLLASALLAPVSSDQFIVGGALLLLGLGWNFGYVTGSSLLSDTLKGSERLRVQGVFDTLVFLAAGLSSLSAGVIFDSLGFAGIASLGIILTLALFGFVILRQRAARQLPAIA